MRKSRRAREEQHKRSRSEKRKQKLGEWRSRENGENMKRGSSRIVTEYMVLEKRVLEEKQRDKKVMKSYVRLILLMHAKMFQ